MDSPLDQRLASALGGRTAQVLEKSFGMHTVGDLLAHYPRRYGRRGELTALSELRIDEPVTIVAEVRSVTERRMQNRRGSILEATISDGHGILTLTFFNQGFRKNELRPGVRGIFSGKIGAYRGTRQLTHPDYELFDPDEAATMDAEQAQRWAETPVPLYPATASFPSWKLQKAVETILDVLPPLPDPVPDEVRAARGLMDFRDALVKVHRPETDADWRRARDALRFQEALVLQLALLGQRAERRAVTGPPRIPGALSEAFEAALPWALTDDQRAVGEQIEAEFLDGTPMNRLLQGEVGSGKTLVALRAMLAVAESGGQSAFLAPTEVLAGQHLRSIVAMLGPDLAARLRVTLLTGQLPAAERRKALLAAASGGAAIVVGTHALLGDQVTFADLGLVIVDEQHRFGVEQREALRLKGQAPHVLVLSATPIPRTVAMTVFGDLDVSTLRTLPAGRAPITSHVVPLAEHPGWEARVWERLAEELAQGRQGFVVCPAIEAGQLEEADAEELEGVEQAVPPAAVDETLARLRTHPSLAGRRIEPLHGRMSGEEKDRVMRAFAAGDIDVLVATTVIEVGVDVPNASTMIVLDADRFGVAQLHQLRGRVGRGGVPGIALFVTRAEQGSLARERVDAVAATLDGFELAQADLELRREGDVLGGTQSGRRSSLKLLRVIEDAEVIAEARAVAEGLLDADPALVGHEALREAVARRFDTAERAFLGKA
ncbi:ATP-dependent DNA helicase RecG [Protaetiibacter intestinalis]|uniref:Probable DNA 3'-5' helicase RecG n=1 Tax=Protaetiibacter intestinalis TaxID=2419774 RepID=A0A387BCB8_9MICO|nr:ATP-dependent DNA helicase RecG [Protaetiibacter intestinalis]AYF98539.1 ATP-dependent DNA helicase RecG [Protaetiibacter intestinalis]